MPEERDEPDTSQDRPVDPYQAAIDAAPRIPELLTKPVDVKAPTASVKPGAIGSMMEAGRAWGVALDFVFTVIGGLVIGYLLDRFAGFKPWGTLGGLTAGFVLAFVRIIKNTLRQEAKEKADREAAKRR